MLNRTAPAGTLAGAILCLLVGLAGCASVESRYEQALEYETQDRHADAAWNYIKILRKEPAYQDARSRLADVGRLAVDDYLSGAETAQTRGDFETAVHELIGLGELASASAEVGVQLPLPSDYRETLSAMQDAAAEALISLGREAEGAGRWAEALSAYETALLRYPGPPSRQRALTRSQVRVLLAWAREDLDGGRGRAAFARAGQALALLGPDDPQAQDAFAIQAAAIELSSRYIVLLPVIPTPEAEVLISRDVLDELDDELVYEQWAAPPEMVVLVDPIVVQRELRREGWQREPITDARAARLGRDLGGDMVVVNQVLSYEVEERVITESVERARIQGTDGVDTTYVKQRFELTFSMEIEFELLDARNAFSLARGRVSGEVDEDFDRGVYEGDPADLGLSTWERRLFDEGSQADAEWELVLKLIQDVTERLTHRTYREITGRIP